MRVENYKIKLELNELYKNSNGNKIKMIKHVNYPLTYSDLIDFKGFYIGLCLNTKKYYLYRQNGSNITNNENEIVSKWEA